VSRKTARGRFTAALRRVAQWCKRFRHLPVAAQHQALSRKLQGHYAYFGITGNARALARFRYEVERRWRLWLSRRSRAAHLAWTAYARLLARYPLPPARVVHSIYRRAATP
jgi:hypothetical protein